MAENNNNVQNTQIGVTNENKEVPVNWEENLTQIDQAVQQNQPQPPAKKPKKALVFKNQSFNPPPVETVQKPAEEIFAQQQPVQQGFVPNIGFQQQPLQQQQGFNQQFGFDPNFVNNQQFFPNQFDQMGNFIQTPQIFYFYPDPILDLLTGQVLMNYKDMNQVCDNFGNWYQLEANEYVQDGMIFSYDDDNGQNEEQTADYWQKYPQKKKEKTSKKQPKNLPPPKIKKPEEYKRNKDKDLKTDSQKIQELMGTVKQQKLYNLAELLEMQDQQILQNPTKLEKVDQERETINIVFIGHVDAGKSTLSGRILVETKEIEQNECDNLALIAKKKHMESWFLAYIMDISENERNRGKTVECGKAHFKLPSRRFTLYDAPGHKNYVPNMIMGACQADVAGLIISANTGEFESGFELGGQTQEHCHLAKALGVQHLICIVTKMDTVNWSQERYHYIQNTVDPFLKLKCGFTSYEWVPIDSYNGQNITGRVDAGLCSWYNGPHLFEVLNKVPVPKRSIEGPIRLPVLDSQKYDGQLYIFGKLESGNIKEDMWVTMMPEKKEFQIANIYDSKDKPIFYACAGENIKIKVRGIEQQDIVRGNMICETTGFCLITQEFMANVQILELPAQKEILSAGYSCILHMHTTQQEIDIKEVCALYDPSSKTYIKTNQKFLKAGMKGIVKISSKRKLCLEKHDIMPCIGRFTLRDENKTIGYGEVTLVKPALDFQQKLLQSQQNSKNKEQQQD